MTNQGLTFSQLLSQGQTAKKEFETSHPDLVNSAIHHFIDPSELDRRDAPPTPPLKTPPLKFSDLLARVPAPPKPKLQVAPLSAVGAWTDAIAHAQSVYPDIELDTSQQFALATILSNHYSCMIGPAGTGKTTVTKFAIASIEALPQHRINPPVIYTMAFTGRATEQIKRQLPEDYKHNCRTIHLTLEYKPFDEEYTDKLTNTTQLKQIFKPTRDQFNKLDNPDWIIVDEAGTVPIELWNNLVRAIPDGTRILLLGDINQLPPVFGKSILGFAMLRWPVAELTTIHRQAADNPIISNAHKVLRGTHPTPNNKKFFMVPIPDTPLQASHAVLQAVARIHTQGAYNPLSDTVITPQNVGDLGQFRLNEFLVTHFNPTPVGGRIFIDCFRETKHFAVGDKVLLTANDTQRQLTNGMTGKITCISRNGNYRPTALGRAILATKEDVSISHDQTDELLNSLTTKQSHIDTLDKEKLNDAIDGASTIDRQDEDTQLQSSHVTTVVFNERPDREYTFSSVGQYAKLHHGYAITCHKSQGGEYETIIIVLHATNSRMLSREWLYTAITRARNKVIILYNDFNKKGLSVACSRQKIVGNTLAEKAQQFIDQSGGGANEDRRKSVAGKEPEKPVLWEPKLVEVRNVS